MDIMRDTVMKNKRLKNDVIEQVDITIILFRLCI